MRIYKPGTFRLFLAFLVVLFHASKYFPFGSFAVNTFFILSGYWIYRMYDEYYVYQKNTYLTFIWSRILRIYPLYYLCTFFAFMVILINPAILNHHIHDFVNFKYIFTLLTIVPYNYLYEKLVPPAWSLGIEMQFYLIAPLCIYLIKKMNAPLFAILALIVSQWISYGHYIIQLSVVPYLIFFIIGMLIWHYKPVASKALVNWSLVVIGIIVGMHYAIPYLRDAILLRETLVWNTNYLFFFYSILPLLFVPLISYSFTQKSDKLDRSLGDLSFTIYLLHWIPFSIYSYYFGANSGSIRIMAFIAYLIVLISMSVLVYISFEKKIENLRKKLLGKG